MDLNTTIILLLATIGASLLAFSNEELMRKWILNPYMVQHRKQWWRMLTSGFIHADFAHLAFNMIAFYGFGMAVESYYLAVFGDHGLFYYLILYLGGILVANAPSLAKHKNNHYYNSLGASGAVSAIIFAAILFDPWSKIYFFGIIGIPGVIFGPLYLIGEKMMSKREGTGINHDAHYWGAIFGLVYTIALKPGLILFFFDQITGR
ncbi:MAG: rhomboid family intramembrane serine protease [Bacteroidia bacterium]